MKFSVRGCAQRAIRFEERYKHERSRQFVHRCTETEDRLSRAVSGHRICRQNYKELEESGRYQRGRRSLRWSKQRIIAQRKERILFGGYPPAGLYSASSRG